MDEVYELQKQTQEKIGDSIDDQPEKQLLAKLDDLQRAIIEAQLQWKNDISSLREQFDVIKDTQESIASLQRHIKKWPKAPSHQKQTGSEQLLDERFTKPSVLVSRAEAIKPVVDKAPDWLITWPATKVLARLGIEDSSKTAA